MDSWRRNEPRSEASRDCDGKTLLSTPYPRGPNATTRRFSRGATLAIRVPERARDVCDRGHTHRWTVTSSSIALRVVMRTKNFRSPVQKLVHVKAISIEPRRSRRTPRQQRRQLMKRVSQEVVSFCALSGLGGKSIGGRVRTRPAVDACISNINALLNQT